MTTDSCYLPVVRAAYSVYKESNVCVYTHTHWNVTDSWMLKGEYVLRSYFRNAERHVVLSKARVCALPLMCSCDDEHVLCSSVWIWECPLPTSRSSVTSTLIFFHEVVCWNSNIKVEIIRTFHSSVLFRVNVAFVIYVFSWETVIRALVLTNTLYSIMFSESVLAPVLRIIVAKCSLEGQPTFGEVSSFWSEMKLGYEVTHCDFRGW